jgi:hypothetical protein
MYNSLSVLNGELIISENFICQKYPDKLWEGDEIKIFVFNADDKL